MPEEKAPGLVVAAKVHWDKPLEAGTQLFMIAPDVAAHAIICIIEELGDVVAASKNEKGAQSVKLRVLVPKELTPKTKFKLHASPLLSALAEGIIEEVT